MKLELSKYQNLPDYLEVNQISNYISDLFHLHKDESESDPLLFADILCQLADRQWHTYELIDVTSRRRIEEWVERNLQTQEISLMKKLCFIILTLGLVDTQNKLKDSLPYLSEGEVKEFLIKYFKEYDDDVSDPYSGLRNK